MAKKDDTSSSEGKSYQTKYTYLFVPAALAREKKRTDDEMNVPGALLRLGGYSDLEERAKEKDELGKFYPREYGKELVGADTGQILLAGNGQMLVYAGGKVFINSGEEMDIDSIGDLRINSDGKTKITSANEIDIESREKPITITSGNGQDITISAGGDKEGDINQYCHQETREVGGSSYSYVNEDSYDYVQANQYAITLGASYSVTLGLSISFFMGMDISINTSLSIGINGPVFCFNGTWIAMSFLTATFDVFTFSKSSVNASKFDAELEITNLNARIDGIVSKTASINVNQSAVNSSTSSVNNNISGITNVL